MTSLSIGLKNQNKFLDTEIFLNFISVIKVLHRLKVTYMYYIKKTKLKLKYF